MTAAIIPREQRKPILDDAMALIMDGVELSEIAQKHGLKKRTLNAWLLSLGDEYRQLREAYIDSELIDASEAIDRAGDALGSRDIPRARAILEYGKAKWNRATWMAERRDRQRYGQAVQAGPTGDMNVVINIGSVAQPSVTIEHDDKG